MRKTIILLILFVFASTCFAQRDRRDNRTLTEGFYINVGMANGPEFSSLINFINDYYSQRYLNNTERIDKFGKAPTMSLGYLLRLYPSFALDIGFTIYRLETKGQILNNNPAFNEFGIRHDLEYQVGVFSVTVPVLFDFSTRQPVVPYAGIGISIFAMRLDDIRDDGVYAIGSRDTGTAIGGHFETGLYVKASREFWVNLRGRWHKGSGNLHAQEPPGLFDKYKIEQDFSQFGAGVVYFFR